MNSAAGPFTDGNGVCVFSVCLSSLRPQTDELVVVVAIEVRGAHAPSRAVAGASPTTFLGCAREAFRRGAEMGTRGRVRSPEKRSGIPQRTLEQLRNGAGVYATGVGKPSALGPTFSFNASVNSCKLETICGALVKTAEASFSA